MTKNEKLQAVFHLYETEHGHQPVTMRDVVSWGVEKGLLARPPKLDPIDVLASQMASALAQEFDTYGGASLSRESCRHESQKTASSRRFGQSWATRRTTTWRGLLRSVGNTFSVSVCSYIPTSLFTTK